MPLKGTVYSIPFADIERSAMPCINIGPWGKDFHKLSERVLKEDLLEGTPTLLLRAIELAFNPALAPRP
jgi:arginine utilization protein RocB